MADAAEPAPPSPPSTPVWVQLLTLPSGSPTGPDDPDRHATAVKRIRAYEAAFAETHNPLYAWSALHHARAVGLAVPEWVLVEYLDAVAERVWTLASDLPKNKDPDSLIAEALGLKRLGRGSVFSDFRGDQYAAHIWLAALVHFRSSAHGKPYLEWENVATEWRVHPSTVRLAWNKYKHLFEPPATTSEPNLPDK